MLFLLQDFWPRLTVYFCDSGSALPETLNLVEKVKRLVPHFISVPGRQPEVVAEYGYPSDLIPSTSSEFGRKQAGDSGLPMLDRYACCGLSIMVPLHNRMREDGITLIIRGQRNDDIQKSPVRSGMSLEGFEFFFPIQDWTEDEVFEFLEDSGVEIPRYYTAGMSAAPDCLNCTAWLEHGLSAYLKDFHPFEYTQQQVRLKAQLDAVAPQYARLVAQIERNEE